METLACGTGVKGRLNVHLTTSNLFHQAASDVGSYLSTARAAQQASRSNCRKMLLASSSMTTVVLYGPV